MPIVSISRGMAQRSGSHACLGILWDLVTILIPGPHPRPPAAASPGWSLETGIFSESIITSNSAFVYLFMSIYSASPRGTEAPCGRRLQLVPHTLNTGPGSLTLNRRMGRRKATETRSQAREPLSGPSPPADRVTGVAPGCRVSDSSGRGRRAEGRAQAGEAHWRGGRAAPRGRLHTERGVRTPPSGEGWVRRNPPKASVRPPTLALPKEREFSVPGEWENGTSCASSTTTHTCDGR